MHIVDLKLTKTSIQVAVEKIDEINELEGSKIFVKDLKTPLPQLEYNWW